MIRSHEKLTIEKIEQFEKNQEIRLPEKYKQFLLKWNGGSPYPNVFNISAEQGPSALNVFNGIGDMYDNLAEFIDILEGRLPNGFIPIGDDSGGNQICLGTEEPYYEKIYFWDHEEEPQDPNDMSNMYFLANDIDEFLDSLYEDGEE